MLSINSVRRRRTHPTRHSFRGEKLQCHVYTSPTKKLILFSLPIFYFVELRAGFSPGEVAVDLSMKISNLCQLPKLTQAPHTRTKLRFTKIRLSLVSVR